MLNAPEKLNGPEKLVMISRICSIVLTIGLKRLQGLSCRDRV